jgi:hypothetical protein
MAAEWWIHVIVSLSAYVSVSTDPDDGGGEDIENVNF